MRKTCTQDLTGKTFGKLTCITFAYTKNGKSFWKCKCQCGKEKIIRSNDLLSKKVLSCGCLKKSLLRERAFCDLTGQTFGYLKVISLDKERTQPPKYYWKCECKCGKIHSVKQEI